MSGCLVTRDPGHPRMEPNECRLLLHVQYLCTTPYLVDVHLAIPIDIRLLYEKVDLRVGQLGAQLSHNVSELLGVDCPRSVLVKKLFFCCEFFSDVFRILFGETFPAGRAASSHRGFGNGIRTTRQGADGYVGQRDYMTRYVDRNRNSFD